MEVVVVFKADGTIQCEDNKPIPLEHHAAQLRKIGASEICGQGNVPGPFIVVDLCGAPTGRVNAFAILKEDWDLILSGTAGTLGFRIWTGAPYPDLEISQGCKISDEAPTGRPAPSIGAYPVLIRELLGRPCRCYRQGDALTKDFIPERANIEHDESGRISDVWFG